MTKKYNTLVIERDKGVTYITMFNADTGDVKTNIKTANMVNTVKDNIYNNYTVEVHIDKHNTLILRIDTYQTCEELLNTINQEK